MKVTFENATIADSVGKAARVAPTKGEAFDKASGILMDLDPDENTVTLRSTNLRVYYLEVVDAVEVASRVTWRFNAQLLSQVLAKLPIGTEKLVTFEQKGNEIHMKSGRTTAKFRTLDTSYYPTWEPYDPNLLEMVPDLGARIQQVEWAASDQEELSFAGIHLDGKCIVATDRFRLAQVPCEAEPIYKPITIPAGVLKPVLANLRDVAIGINENQFLLMPDVATQIRTPIYAHEYPNVTAALEKQEWPQSIPLRKAALIEIIDRAVIFAQRDRSPKITVIIGKGEIAVMCTDAEMGLLGDAIEVEGADHPRKHFYFTPKNLADALAAAPSEQVELYYDIDSARKPFKIDGGSGFTALVMPRTTQESE
jgi:DNA polymerase III sliding clamp (beta) subunit (PCNA family)